MRGRRSLLGHERPLEAAKIVGYLPEERGLYPAMTTREAIAFMGALRGLPLEIGAQARRDPAPARTASATMSTSRSRASPRAWPRPSNCSARSSTGRSWSCSTSPFPGLDAINQGRLEHLIRDEAAAGTTIIFSTHVIHHAERLCERIAIIAGGKIRFEGLVSEARDRLRPQVRLKTRNADGRVAQRRCRATRARSATCGSSSCPRAASSRC